MNLPPIPEGSVLGINFSGMHDSAIAIVAPDGTPVFAMSLERLSRVKQDGRPPFRLLESIPWKRIAKVAIPTYAELPASWDEESKVHPRALPRPRLEGLRHPQRFHEFFESIPCAKEFVGHQLSHVSSAFWGSEFEEAIGFTYDGGMANDPYFGGLYRCSRRDGIVALDRFSAARYAKITSLYSIVTALLGFMPNRHEGKITGLAAYGQPSEPCLALLGQWFGEEYLDLEAGLRWVLAYDDESPARLITDPVRLAPFKAKLDQFAPAEVAASIQAFAEQHVAEILRGARAQGWASANICLAGGLFANVKINQRVLETGFERLFVAPPMTDDGTALGAAWQALSSEPGFAPKPLASMYLGASFPAQGNARIASERRIRVQSPADPAKEVATLLAKGKVVALFQGATEYGPRALGNRSILAAATDAGINRTLNERLNRTEFMPFAPVSRAEDAERLYHGIGKVSHAAQFMTVTLECTEEMRRTSPAVVHVDHTARPQLVTADGNPLLHEILAEYAQLTGHLALVNTSFNIHEEPIVCSPEDALRGFFESGIDYLYLEGAGLVPFHGNEAVAVRYLHERLRRGSRSLVELNALLARERGEAVASLEEKEAVIQRQDATLRTWQGMLEEQKRAIEGFSAAEQDRGALRRSLEEKEALIGSLKVAIEDARAQHALLVKTLGEREQAIQMLNQVMQSPEFHITMVKGLEEKEAVIRELSAALDAYRRAFSVVGFFVRPLNSLARLMRFMTDPLRHLLVPRLGVLTQHEPHELKLPAHYAKPIAVVAPAPRISIVTPSYKHAAFIERTILSVLDQRYPNLEYRVQDGASGDGTEEILRRHESRLAGWESVPDGGQSAAINSGFARTTGEIMAWLNSDDILLPGALAYVANYFTQHPDIDVVYGHRICIDEQDRQIGQWILPAHDGSVLSWADYVPQETLFWRRRIWDRAGGKVDESFRFAMDWDLLVRFREAGARFARLPRFIGGFRIHAAQKTSAGISEIGFREMDRIRERIHGRVPSRVEVSKAVMPYLIRHAAADFGWRVGSRLGIAS